MLRIYGASDDLIEIEGDDNDEIGAYDTTKYLHFDTGHILKVWYPDDGIWKVEMVRGGRGPCEIVTCNDPDADPYSDVATIAEATKWCATEKPDGPTSDDIECWWEQIQLSPDIDTIMRSAYMAAHPWLTNTPKETP